MHSLYKHATYWLCKPKAGFLNFFQFLKMPSCITLKFANFHDCSGIDCYACSVIEGMYTSNVNFRTFCPILTDTPEDFIKLIVPIAVTTVVIIAVIIFIVTITHILTRVFIARRKAGTFKNPLVLIYSYAWYNI